MVFLRSLSDKFAKSPGRSSQCCSLDGLHSSSYFQVLLPFYQLFGDSTKSTNYNWYNHHFKVPHFFFNSLTRSRYLSFFFAFFPFYLMVSRDSKVHNSASSLLLCVFCLVPSLIVSLLITDSKGML